MRLQTNSGGIKFQIQELMVTLGVLSFCIWNSPRLGITLVVMGILGAVCRTAFEIAEKTRIAEAKNAESEKIKSATSALADAFGGFGSKPDTGAH